MVSKPDFDPNEVEKLGSNIRRPEKPVLVNRDTGHTAGSTFKILTTFRIYE